MLIINFDEGGGFFDHVPPPLAPLPSTDRALGNDGRVGDEAGTHCLAMVTAPRGDIALYDHTKSVLAPIEWRWNLRPLTVRDASTNNPAEDLDFDAPDFAAPRFSIPAGPYGGVCTTAAPTDENRRACRNVVARLHDTARVSDRLSGRTSPVTHTLRGLQKMELLATDAMPRLELITLI